MAPKLSVVRVRAIFRTFAIAAEHDGGSGALCGEGELYCHFMLLLYHCPKFLSSHWTIVYNPIE
jgi:hypothetical protein